MYLFFVVTERILASEDENEAMHLLLLVLVLFKFYFCDKFVNENLEF